LGYAWHVFRGGQAGRAGLFALCVGVVWGVLMAIALVGGTISMALAYLR
jgi:hypothetical protein